MSMHIYCMFTHSCNEIIAFLSWTFEKEKLWTHAWNIYQLNCGHLQLIHNIMDTLLSIITCLTVDITAQTHARHNNYQPNCGHFNNLGVCIQLVCTHTWNEKSLIAEIWNAQKSLTDTSHTFTNRNVDTCIWYMKSRTHTWHNYLPYRGHTLSRRHTLDITFTRPTVDISIIHEDAYNLYTHTTGKTRWFSNHECRLISQFEKGQS